MGKQTFDRLKKTLLISLVVLFIATLAAASVSAKIVDVYAVDKPDHRFFPSIVKIAPGDTVRWWNMDTSGGDHTATGSTFDSGKIHVGNSYEYTFPTSGVYDYKCMIAPVMTGTVMVDSSYGGNTSYCICYNNTSYTPTYPPTYTPTTPSYTPPTYTPTTPSY